MCLGDWKTHGSEYYECSRYKENPNIAHESAHAQAREALKKYLHYFERVRIFVRGSRAIPIFGNNEKNCVFNKLFSSLSSIKVKLNIQSNS